ncbi:MAG: HAD family hydrolase [bacterium]
MSKTLHAVAGSVDLSRIKAISFDLDDTLWHCAPVISRAEERFHRWLEQAFPMIANKHSLDELRQHRVLFMEANPEYGHHLTELRKRWLQGLGAEAGVGGEALKRLVEEGFEIYWRARNEVELFTPVEDTLTVLREHFLVGAMTNGNADVNTIGIGHLFDFVVTSMESGAAKPARASFDLATEKAGLPHSEFLHVGDDWRSDIEGAMSAGMQAAWVHHSSGEDAAASGLRYAADAEVDVQQRLAGMQNIIVINSIEALPSLLLPEG